MLVLLLGSTLSSRVLDKTCYDEHWVLYGIVKSLHYTPEAKITLLTVLELKLKLSLKNAVIDLCSSTIISFVCVLTSFLREFL